MTIKNVESGNSNTFFSQKSHLLLSGHFEEKIHQTGSLIIGDSCGCNVIPSNDTQHPLCSKKMLTVDCLVNIQSDKYLNSRLAGPLLRHI